MGQVTDFFRKLFDTSDWPPRWHCGRWSEFHGWLYIISDLMIWSAYFAIPFIIIRFISRKQNARFLRLYFLFATFILACGATHFLDAIIFWIPVYRVSALVKFITGVISWATVYYLVRLLPVAFSQKTAIELEQQVEEKDQEIKITESRFYAIIENMSECILLMDDHFQPIYINSAAKKMTEWSDEGQQASWITRLHPEELDKVNSILKEVTAGHGQTFRISFRIQHKKGDYVWAEGHIDNQLNNPAVKAIVFNFRDVTDIKQAEQKIKALNESLEEKVAERTRQLEEANKELEAFSYSVSHDLRAPLRVINGYADILSADYKNELEAEGNRLLDIIISNVKKMNILIDELLNLSRLGRKAVVLRRGDMNMLVKSVIEEQMTLKKDNVTFTVADLPSADFDLELLRQVWNNLISNAIKYSSKNEAPKVEISFFKNDKEMVYLVKDNGVGFNMEYSHKLFGVFQRLHNRADFEGTGVGLVLVQRIIHKHKGKVWAEAEEGKGATFYFSLPLHTNLYGTAAD